METKAAGAGATSTRLYEDFEPYCKWLPDQTLQVDLKGFKKEQLKVRTNGGILTICGERPLDASNHRWNRFHKELRLPKDTDMNEIRAKFSRGVLSIVLPKRAQQPNLKTEEAKKENISGVAMEKHSVWGIKIRKGTAIKVAVVVVIVVVMVALWTQIARLGHKHRPRDFAGKDTML